MALYRAVANRRSSFHLIGLRASGYIVDETIDREPAIAHKGTMRYRCHARGKFMYSGLETYRINAIEYAYRPIYFISDVVDVEQQREKVQADIKVLSSNIRTTMKGDGFLKIQYRRLMRFYSDKDVF